MARVNPQDPKLKLEPRYICRPGRAVFAITKFVRETTQGGTPMILIGVVCVKDPKRPDPKFDPPTDVGLPCKIRLYDTEKGLRRWGLLAIALGYNEPFDSESDEDIEKMLSSNKGIFIGEVKVEEGKYAEIDSVAPFTGAFDPEWSDIIAKGEEDFDAAQQRRAEYNSRSGNGSTQRKRTSSPVPGDDEVPF